MHLAALLLAGVLVAGDPIGDFTIEGLRVGSSFDDALSRFPNLRWIPEEVHRSGCSTWRTDREFENMGWIKLEYVRDYLNCITVYYEQAQIDSHGLNTLCEAIADRFGVPESEYVLDGNTVRIWYSGDRKFMAMLVKYPDRPLVALAVMTAGTAERWKASQKKAVNPGF